MKSIVKGALVNDTRVIKFSVNAQFTDKRRVSSIAYQLGKGLKNIEINVVLNDGWFDATVKGDL